MNNNTYTIPAVKHEDIQKMITRLQKKASKYGKRFTVEYSDFYCKLVPVYEIGLDPVTGTQAKFHDRDELIEVFDLTVESDIICKDGYTVIAQIEHLDGGNIVKTFGGEVRESWINSDCRCEHCKTNRVRKLNYIVRGEDGAELQVGSSCLMDYCGIDPQAIGYRNQLDEILLNADVDNWDFHGNPLPSAYDIIEALAGAIKVYRQYGYVRSDMPGSNKERLFDLLHSTDSLEKELAEATAMAEAIESMSNSDAIQFLLSDTRTLVRSHYCKKSYLGYIAYAPVAYEKYQKELERKARIEAEKESQKASQYVGEIGKRMTFDIAEMKLVTSWETQYGMTFLYKFIDVNGNVLVWFASGVMTTCEKGHYEEVTSCKQIKATVKAHSEREGVRQTIITRCKVA